MQTTQIAEVLIKAGIGILQHKILIDVDERRVPQLSPEYQTGYDRMARGVALSQFVGLIKLQREQFVNLYFGIELMEGFTKNQRGWDFHTNSKDDKLRFDMLIGLKLGWIIPVFTGQTNDTYYYY